MEEKKKVSLGGNDTDTACAGYTYMGVSCDICVYHLGLCVFFPGVFLSSRVTGACPVTTDLIMRVSVRTTTTTTLMRTHNNS